MKKILTMLLLSAMLVSFASCNTNNTDNTTSTADSSTETTDATTDNGGTNDTTMFVSPSDETNVTKTIVKENEDGIKMEITLYGYASERLGKEFYVKHDEYINAEVKITNGSDSSYYQTMPTFCSDMLIPHCHEVAMTLTDTNGHKLTNHTANRACFEKTSTWEIKAGETYRFWLRYVAGEARSDLGEGDNIAISDFILYNDIYTDGICEFSGNISFGYSDGQQNDREIDADVTLEVVYAERSVPSTTHPEDHKRVYKNFITQNEDLELKVVFEVYESESLGEDAYFTRTENIYGHFYIKNTSDHSVYFYLHDPMEMVGYSEPQEFDIDLKTTDGYILDHLMGYVGFDHGMERIELKPGEMFMRTLRFAAGEYINGYYVDANGNDCYTDGGFRYYGADAYRDGKMVFGGTISFDYFESLDAENVTGETKTIATDVSLTCLYEDFERPEK